MRCATLLLLCVSIPSPAQSPAELFEKAPPAVDDALRARVAKFYQAHVDGKFRVADQVVAEESKDYFFELEKRRYSAFEISKINYLESFTKARVLVTADGDLMLPTGRVAAKIPLITAWKLIDGEWFWHASPSDGRITPFGIMGPGPKGSETSPAPVFRAPDMAALLRQVSADKDEVRLNRTTPSSETVTISNKMAGTVTLVLDVPATEGLEVKLDRNEVKAGESAVLSFRFQPGKTTVFPTFTAKVMVQTTGRAIPIRVMFTGQ